MRTLEIMGKTVDEAVKSALVQLNVSKDDVEIQVLEEGSKGLFKIIGSKPAKVLVKVKNDYIYESKKFLKDVLDKMSVTAEIVVEEKDDTIRIELKGKDMGILIGYRGETLDALQYLLSLVINKYNENTYKRVVLDTENYRAKREETLQNLANKMAHNVKRSGKVFKLEPMNPYERRVIHSALQNDKYVSTYSEGEEPYRRVVIELKKA